MLLFIIESSTSSDYVSFNVLDRTIEEGTSEDTAKICLTSMTSQQLNGSISISDIGNAGVDSTYIILWLCAWHSCWLLPGSIEHSYFSAKHVPGDS